MLLRSWLPHIDRDEMQPNLPLQTLPKVVEHGSEPRRSRSFFGTTAPDNGRTASLIRQRGFAECTP